MDQVGLFAYAAAAVGASGAALGRGLFVPSVPAGGATMALAMVGTTCVLSVCVPSAAED